MFNVHMDKERWGGSYLWSIFASDTVPPSDTEHIFCELPILSIFLMDVFVFSSPVLRKMKQKMKIWKKA